MSYRRDRDTLVICSVSVRSLSVCYPVLITKNSNKLYINLLLLLNRHLTNYNNTTGKLALVLRLEIRGITFQEWVVPTRLQSMLFVGATGCTLLGIWALTLKPTCLSKKLKLSGGSSEEWECRGTIIGWLFCRVVHCSCCIILQNNRSHNLESYTCSFHDLISTINNRDY